MASTVHAIGSHHGKPPAPTEKMSASASWECPKGDKCYVCDCFVDACHTHVATKKRKLEQSTC